MVGLVKTFSVMRNNRGLSLVEIMIALGLIGGVSLIVMNITKQSVQSSTKFQFDSDVTLTTNEINGILSDPAKCLAIFASTSTPTNINGKYYIATSASAPANGYGNSGLKVASYTLNGTAPNGVLTIEYQNKNILKGTGGISNIPKKLNIHIEGVPGAITKCRALSTSTTEIWSHGIGSNIYYSGGNVGIGTTSPPVTALEVNGEIRAMGVSPGSNCTVLGAQAFDSATGAPLYCNNGSPKQWTKVGGSLNCMQVDSPIIYQTFSAYVPSTATSSTAIGVMYKATATVSCPATYQMVACGGDRTTGMGWKADVSTRFTYLTSSFPPKQYIDATGSCVVTGTTVILGIDSAARNSGVSDINPTGSNAVAKGTCCKID